MSFIKNMNSTKKVVLITSVNSPWDYACYLPIYIHSWRKLFPQAEIHIAYSDPKIGKLKNYFNNLNINFMQVDPVIGVDSRVQSKFNRMWVAQKNEFSNSRIILSDVDTVPLNSELAGVIGEFLISDFVKWDSDHPIYLANENFGKWCMDKTQGNGKQFQELINPNRKDLQSLIKSEWLKNNFDGKENVYLRFRHFSDESLMRLLWKNNNINFKTTFSSRQNSDFLNFRNVIDKDWYPSHFLSRIMSKLFTREYTGVIVNIFKIIFGNQSELRGYRPINKHPLVAFFLCKRIGYSYNSFKAYEKVFRKLENCQPQF